MREGTRVQIQVLRMESDSRDVDILAAVAKARGCVMKGGEADLDKAARLLLEDFRSLRLGCLSLETPEDWETGTGQN